MIRVNLREPDGERWRLWKAEAATERQRLEARFAAGERISGADIRDVVYKRCRAELFEMYGGKCAYCEAKIVLDQSGDIDHFRPKARVTDRDDHEVLVNGDPHPGYFWLAYEWTNLLPSCDLCNRPRRRGKKARTGKGCRFPVAGAYAIVPGGESAELPLLIHPALDVPEQHIEYDIDTGLYIHKTQAGESTIDVCGLNREGLPEARLAQYVVTAALYKQVIDRVAAGGCTQLSIVTDQDIDLLEKHKAGTSAYSRPARVAIRVKHAEYLHALEALKALG